jgi:heme oxygenase
MLEVPVTSFDEGLLSLVLRRRLAPVHTALEQASGLPGCIVTTADYIAYLHMHYDIVATLEEALDAVPDGLAAPMAMPVRRAPHLRDDLRRLGARVRRPIAPMPRLAGAAQAVGVRYVLEGSALGGQVILAAVQPRLGADIEGATSFFAGFGRHGMARWRAFTAALDAYGAAHPTAQDAVVEGAALAFGMFLEAARQPALGAPA